MEGFLNHDFYYAVVGATTNPEKFGYKVPKKLLENEFNVVGVNPKYGEVAGVACFADLARAVPKPDVVVTIVPPAVTEDVVRQCLELSIGRVWMQPGSESDAAIRFCEGNGIAVIHHACIVVDGLGQSF